MDLLKNNILGVIFLIITTFFSVALLALSIFKILSKRRTHADSETELFDVTDEVTECSVTFL